MEKIKEYNDRIPACGIFCGGCPTYVREKNPCPGAGINFARCEKCRSYHLCCLEKGITHCYQCATFPCKRLKSFTVRWLKYGQNIIDNQHMLERMGERGFLEYFNNKS